MLKLQSKLFYGGLKSYDAEMTEERADELLDKYINEGGDMEEVNTFLSTQYSNFIKPQVVKTVKKMKIINE